MSWRLETGAGCRTPPELTGFAVAGGKSRRMGEDKALLAWEPATLLDHTLARLRACCGRVRILCGPEPRYADRDVPVDVDVVADAGALGGILTGLSKVGLGLGVFLAVDVPWVPAALLQRLVALAPGHDVVVPVSPAGLEPLCAVYRSTCLEPIRRRLRKGDLRVMGFFSDVQVREAHGAEISAYGDPTTMFRNVNTPAEYAEARRSAGLTGAARPRDR